MVNSNQVKCKLTKTHIDKSKCDICENLKKCEAQWKAAATKERNNQTNPDMIKHFGLWFNKTKTNLKINRDTYVTVNNKSSFGDGIVYDDKWCEKHKEKCLINFDKNMEAFSKIDKDGLNWFLRDIMTWGDFKEVKDLNDYDGIPGVYIMVLGEYSQMYIGQSNNIKKRIQQHWTATKEFDRLIFGGVDNSVLSIDSFGPLDTTRIIVLEINDENRRYGIEMFLTENIHQVYQLNRIGGGGISDAISVLATLNRLGMKDLQEDARYAHVTYFEKKYEIPLHYLKNGTTVCFVVKDDKTDEITEHYGCFIGLPNFSVLTLIEYCSDGSAACYTEHLFDCHGSEAKSKAAIRYYTKDQIIEAWKVDEIEKTICIYVPKQN